DRFELAAPTQTLNVCFRYQPQALDTDREATDRLNVEIRERLRRGGRALVNYATVGGRPAIRLVFANPEVTEADVGRFFDLFADAAD
ncbi:MAG: glutamate decarboxylase, partial [bacterium]|nr:glutamate decarboxylase [bacterium]